MSPINTLRPPLSPLPLTVVSPGTPLLPLLPVTFALALPLALPLPLLPLPVAPLIVVEGAEDDVPTLPLLTPLPLLALPDCPGRWLPPR